MEGDKSLEAYALWKKTYPRDWTPYNNSAVQHQGFGQWEESLENGLEAIRLNPNHVFPYTNAAFAYLQLGRWEEAAAIAQQAIDNGLEDAFIHWGLAVPAHENGDFEKRDEELAWADGTPAQAYLRGMSAMYATDRGQWREADDYYADIIAVLERHQLPGMVGRMESDRAMQLTFLGLESEAVAAARKAVAAPASDESLTHSAIALGLAGLAEEARAALDELQGAYPTATITREIQTPAVEAAIALGQGDAAAALEALEHGRTYERARQYIPYLRGLAYLESGNGEAAAVEFSKCIDWPDGVPILAFDSVSLLGLARAQAMSGDTEAARRSYQDLLEDWAAADEDLPVVQQASGRVRGAQMIGSVDRESSPGICDYSGGQRMRKTARRQTVRRQKSDARRQTPENKIES